ncbi:MmgE/PrpD family protein [Bradyrhizobium sp. CCGUVB14]|uniref:MmgE/PrpD family protein n=1 Tax=Bradyrhizobium sp. CCGUVB14 TaxID=2949628 RepID=UPI0020B18585|nr:MmgE/PrpD family protein [Bradyrhizobium sp. CCGUVB14]MCP3446547.1 MmgE/PrpD family protein [Bradyrhizobium sp. CCGUVB14]
MKRRDFLRLTTTGLALAPARGFAEGPLTSPEMTALCDYMGAAKTRALPPDVVEQAKHHILDSLASMISGSELPPGQAAQRYIRANATQGSSTVAGTAMTASPVEAALANGVMAHADETDDSHSPSRSHPGCSVIPAALALGEHLGIEGGHFLRAVTLGYDVGTRVVVAMGGADFSYDSLLSTHSISGTFCASAAAACVAGFDAQRMRWVLDYAAQQSSGFIVWRRDVDHIEKGFVFAGMPARNGVTSALLVRSDWNGVDDVFSGPDNYFQAHAPKATLGKLVDKLGERYEIAGTDIKKWTVGSPIQGPLDAIYAIRGKHAFEAEEVSHVTVRLAPPVAEIVDNRDIPDICLQHMVAVMLLDKTASFHAAHDKPRMQDAAVLQMRAKVNLVRDEELAKLLPVRVAVVEIELADGSKLSERVTAVRGTPRNPMTREEVIDKARDLIAPVVGRDKSEQLVKSVYEIEAVTDIRSLRSLIQRT